MRKTGSKTKWQRLDLNLWPPDYTVIEDILWALPRYLAGIVASIACSRADDRPPLHYLC